jgi:hypothetical protein
LFHCSGLVGADARHRPQIDGSLVPVLAERPHALWQQVGVLCSRLDDA